MLKSKSTSKLWTSPGKWRNAMIEVDLSEKIVSQISGFIVVFPIKLPFGVSTIFGQTQIPQDCFFKTIHIISLSCLCFVESCQASSLQASRLADEQDPPTSPKRPWSVPVENVACTGQILIEVTKAMCPTIASSVHASLPEFDTVKVATNS